MRRTFRIIGLFCFVFNPPVASFNLIHILAVIALVYVLLKPEAQRILADVYKKSSVLILAYAICAFICVLNGKTNTLLDFFAVLVEIIPIAVAFVSIYKKQYQILVDDIVLAGCLQAAISIIAFLFPPFQTLIVVRMVSVGYSDIFSTIAGWRMFGLSRELTFAMPVTQSLIASLCLYLSIIKEKKYFIPIPFLVFSSFINARTGMVVFVFGAIVLLFCVYRLKRVSFFNLIFAGIAVVAVISLFSSLLSRNESTSDWLMSGFEDVESFVKGEELDEKESYFVGVIDSKRYKVPDSVDQLFFGTGERVQGRNNRYKSDIGFINDIWLGGVVYLFLVWRFFLSRTFRIIKSDAKSRKLGREDLLAYGFVIILVVTNIKGQLFTWNEFINFWFLLFVMYISKRKGLKFS